MRARPASVKPASVGLAVTGPSANAVGMATNSAAAAATLRRRVEGSIANPQCWTLTSKRTASRDGSRQPAIVARQDAADKISKAALDLRLILIFRSFRGRADR